MRPGLSLASPDTGGGQIDKFCLLPASARRCRGRAVWHTVVVCCSSGLLTCCRTRSARKAAGKRVVVVAECKGQTSVRSSAVANFHLRVPGRLDAAVLGFSAAAGEFGCIDALLHVHTCAKGFSLLSAVFAP